MILQALARHYEDLIALNLIAPPGWGDRGISFALCINDAGELERVIDIRQSLGKGKPKPQNMKLPSSPTGRTSTAVKPAFLWDNAKYLLGIDNDGKSNSKYFEGSRRLHQRLLNGVDSPAARAVLAFFEHWEPAQAGVHPAMADSIEDILPSANMVFRYDGRYVHTDQLIQDAWQTYYDGDGDGPTMVCLVTGREASIESVHPPIKGVQGAQPSGAALVSFNAPAFCSYGKDQNLNAPTSKYAAFAYTSALNHLLADREHVQRVGDTTVVCWAEGGESAFQDAFGAFAFGAQSSYDEKALRGMVDNLLRGRPVVFDETLLDPDRPFYILGMAPNAARLSVRFFLRDSFGQLLENIRKHHQRLEIVRPAFDKLETLPLWKLLSEAVNHKADSSNMVGAVMRSILMDEPYPATLLHGVLLRIRAEREVTRGRAAILKAYYLKRLEINHPDIPKEVLTVALNPNCTDIPYTLGRLFSVLEDIQKKAIGKITIRDRYFNAASSMPNYTFTTLIKLAQKHLSKLESGARDDYEQQIAELYNILPERIPPRLTLPQQGSFQIGYYHQTQKRYEKKEENENV